MTVNKEQIVITSRIERTNVVPITKVPYPVPKDREGHYGTTYSCENMFPIPGCEVYCGSVKLEHVLEVNLVEKWARCSTGKVDLYAEEFVNYRVDGDIVMVLNNAK